MKLFSTFFIVLILFFGCAPKDPIPSDKKDKNHNERLHIKPPPAPSEKEDTATIVTQPVSSQDPENVAEQNTLNLVPIEPLSDEPGLTAEETNRAVEPEEEIASLEDTSVTAPVSTPEEDTIPLEDNLTEDQLLIARINKRYFDYIDLKTDWEAQSYQIEELIDQSTNQDFLQPLLHVQSSINELPVTDTQIKELEEALSEENIFTYSEDRINAEETYEHINKYVNALDTAFQLSLTYMALAQENPEIMYAQTEDNDSDQTVANETDTEVPVVETIAIETTPQTDEETPVVDKNKEPVVSATDNTPRQLPPATVAVSDAETTEDTPVAGTEPPTETVIAADESAASDATQEEETSFTDQVISVWKSITQQWFTDDDEETIDTKKEIVTNDLPTADENKEPVISATDNTPREFPPVVVSDAETTEDTSVAGTDEQTSIASTETTPQTYEEALVVETTEPAFADDTSATSTLREFPPVAVSDTETTEDTSVADTETSIASTETTPQTYEEALVVETTEPAFSDDTSATSTLRKFPPVAVSDTETTEDTSVAGADEQTPAETVIAADENVDSPATQEEETSFTEDIAAAWYGVKLWASETFKISNLTGWIIEPTSLHDRPETNSVVDSEEEEIARIEAVSPPHQLIHKFLQDLQQLTQMNNIENIDALALYLDSLASPDLVITANEAALLHSLNRTIESIADQTNDIAYFVESSGYTSDTLSQEDIVSLISMFSYYGD